LKTLPYISFFLAGVKPAATFYFGRA
jgi:hypothetical protein